MITIGRTKENFLLISPLTGKLEIYLQSLWNTSSIERISLISLALCISSHQLFFYIIFPGQCQDLGRMHTIRGREKEMQQGRRHQLRNYGNSPN